jgi:hypothetical protein
MLAFPTEWRATNAGSTATTARRGNPIFGSVNSDALRVQPKRNGSSFGP